MVSHYVQANDQVSEALEHGGAVVALESTIISHGMPYPKNVETALEVERIIRENGAVPATVGIIGGKLKAGLTVDEIEYMGKEPGIAKVSRRDLAYIAAKGLDGATTVAATMMIARMAGIGIFATGGIGGVHRGGETTMDISADLEELARTDVAVVCAGAKSILDIGLTLEYLETKGVPVFGNQTGEMPAFYTRESGFQVDYRFDTPEEMAGILRTKRALGLTGGMLIVNPIPEEYSMDREMISAVIEKAVAKAEEQGIRGKKLTPFLLSEIKEVTGGDSLEANIQLVYSNARLAAQIARAAAV